MSEPARDEGEWVLEKDAIHGGRVPVPAASHHPSGLLFVVPKSRLAAVEAERDKWIAKEQEHARLEYIDALGKAERRVQELERMRDLATEEMRGAAVDLSAALDRSDLLAARVQELESALRDCREAHKRPLPLRPLIELKRVAQEDADGCGVAVLAMLTRQTYAAVDAEWPLRLTEHWKDHDVKPHMMRGYLWERGYHLLVVRDRRYALALGWPSLQPFAPMHYAMVDSPTQPTGHWIAIDGEGVVLDPFDATRTTLDIYGKMHEVVGVWPPVPAQGHDPLVEAIKNPPRLSENGGAQIP